MMAWLKYNKLSYWLYYNYLKLRNYNINCYVFVATTGRSGTNSLCNLFSASPKVISLHEPCPVMFSDNSDFTDKEQLALSSSKRKLLSILSYAANNKVYIEASHLFIKNFSNIVLSFLPKGKLRFVHLKRAPIEVAESFYQIGSIPGKTARGIRYLLDPKKCDNLLKVPELFTDTSYSHDFYKCLWYWYEIEKRVEKLKKSNPEILWMNITTESLNDRNTLVDLVRFVGLSKSDVQFCEKFKEKSNDKKNEKTTPIDFNSFEMNERFKNLLKNQI